MTRSDFKWPHVALTSIEPLPSKNIFLVQYSNPQSYGEAARNPFWESDQGIKICSIFKVLGLRRKECHCVCLVFLIPAVYLFSRMESVWRIYRDFITESKRSKLGADCTCPYSPYGHVENRTITLTWQRSDVACLYWLIIGELSVDTCHQR